MYKICILDKLYAKYDKENGAEVETTAVNIDLSSNYSGDAITKEIILKTACSMLCIYHENHELSSLDEYFMLTLFEDDNSNEITDIENFNGQIYIADYTIKVYHLETVSPSNIN